MLEVIEDADRYVAAFSQFEKSLPDMEHSWLHEIRTAAIDRFVEIGFPTLQDEEWRFTNVAPLVKASFAKAAASHLEDGAVRRLPRRIFAGSRAVRLVFVNGHYSAKLSSVSPLPDGVVAGSLAQALESYPDRVKPYLAKLASYQDHAFVALNTAFIEDGAFIAIPKGKVVGEPIHIVHVATSSSKPTVSHPRNLILAGVNSQAAIVESYVGPEEAIYFTNAVGEVVLRENAIIDYYKLQQESKASFHFATLQVQQERNSNFSSHAINLGGGMVRNDINIVLNDEGCECTLNGLYMGSGKQLIDNHTRIDHTKPHCTSHELYKGILDGRAHGVFNGKIFVHQDAQKTDAKQTNKTLLLSEDAQINAQPQLEIYADDVKCTHGATIGQLADEAIFYLRSRGIGEGEARSLLTFAFANDIISRIKIAPIRSELEEMLLAAQSLPAGRNIEEGGP